MWLLSPASAWWMSRRLRAAPPRLSGEDFAFLRAVARRTWRYFETFVAPVDNHLPPDNFQENPPNGIAHRTSPTNLGLYLLSTTVAHDFGWIGILDMARRLEDTLETMEVDIDEVGHARLRWPDDTGVDPYEVRA